MDGIRKESRGIEVFFYTRIEDFLMGKSIKERVWMNENKWSEDEKRKKKIFRKMNF